MKKLLTTFLIPSFFVLHSLFLAAPARAQTCPSGGVWNGQCCDYKDSTHLIPDPDPGGRCNPTTCSKENFAPNPGGLNYGGECKYCNPNVCKHGSACEDICNWNCCGSEDGEEGDCHMDDENLTTCCPIKRGALQGLLDGLKALIENAIDALIPISLTVKDFRASEDFEKATDYYYGSVHSPFEEGVFFKLAPPNLLQERFPNEGDEVRKREEYARWDMALDPTSGDTTAASVNDGKLKHVEPYRFAVENLRNFLVAIPKPENGTTSQKSSEAVLANYPPPNPQNPGEVLSADAIARCLLPVEEAETKRTCTPDDAPGAGLGLGDLWNLVSGGINLFPKIADLDKIGHYTTGVETDSGEGTARTEDPNYPDGGFLEIFKLPGDEYDDRNAEGNADDLTLLFKIPIPFTDKSFDVPIHIGSEDLKLSHQGSDTNERERDNGVWDKLTPPKVEDSTTSFEGPNEPTVYLASNPSVQGTAYYPQNLSLTEKIGRKIGEWLGRLITL